jgi:hypothetical protein
LKPHRELDPRLNPQLAKDGLDLVGDGARAGAATGGDVLMGRSAQQERDHGAFRLGQGCQRAFAAERVRPHEQVLTRNDDEVLRGLENMGFVAEGGDRELLKRVGREYLKVLGNVRIGDFSRLDREAIEKLSGFQQVRGQLRAIMKSVEYPDGYFYVERTLALLFGLVGALAPKAGLPGLVMPYASRALAGGFFGTHKSAS